MIACLPPPNVFFCRVVAGRGGRAGIQDGVRAVPGGRRESEPRVCAARGGGTRACAGRAHTVFRRARAHAAPCKGTPRGGSAGRLILVCQIVKYPTRDEVASEQGVGAHFDAGFLTFVSPLISHSVPAFLFTTRGFGFVPRLRDNQFIIKCIMLQLLQASDHPGLQVQNLSGQWIDVSPRPYTFVINFGKGTWPSLRCRNVLAGRGMCMCITY
jgi:hypothetical protein